LFKLRADNTINFTEGAIYPDAKIRSVSDFSDPQLVFIKQTNGTGRYVSISDFNLNAQIFQPNSLTFTLDKDIFRQKITLKEAGKLTTQFKNDIVNFIYKIRK